MNGLKKIGNILFNAAFTVIMVSSILCLIGYLVGLRPFIVISGSMEPIIQTGSVCIIDTNEDYYNIKVGDVVSYRKSSSLVIHRVIAITDDGMETKGDNNEVTDGISTTYENFGGKVLFSIPYLGYVINWIRTPQVLVVMIGVIISIILLSVIHHVYEEEKIEYRDDIIEEQKIMMIEPTPVLGSQKMIPIEEHNKLQLPVTVPRRRMNKQQYIRYSGLTVLAVGVVVGIFMFKNEK